MMTCTDRKDTLFSYDVYTSTENLAITEISITAMVCESKKSTNLNHCSQISIDSTNFMNSYVDIWQVKIK